jgi:hypothetical protein
MHLSKYKFNTMYHQKQLQTIIEACNGELDVNPERKKRLD